MKFLFWIFLFIVFTSCNTLKEAGKVIRNEKINTTDEFLVEKKDPLIYPPDYKELPAPSSIEGANKKISDEEKLKKVIKAPKEEQSANKKRSSVEDSIINNIRK